MTDLDARYGRHHRRSGIRIVLAVAAIATAIIWAAWAGFRPQEASGVLYAYRVVDDHHVEVTLLVHRRHAQAAKCLVFAQAEDHSTVGERTVDVAAGGAEQRRVRAVIATERRAVNGVLRRCDSAGGSRGE